MRHKYRACALEPGATTTEPKHPGAGSAAGEAAAMRSPRRRSESKAHAPSKPQHGQR